MCGGSPDPPDEPNPRRAAAGVVLLLAAALAFVYANVLFGGRSLVASENYNPMRPIEGEVSYGPGFVPHEVWRVRGLHLSAGFYDPGAAWWIWEPAAHYLRNALARGELPFWDPYVGAGTPAMANLNATHFFPPYLLVVLLGAGSLVKSLYELGLLLFAGFCTYLLLRRHDLSHVGAAFGGLAFMLSGALNQAIISLGGQTAACAPFLLLVTRWFLDRPDARRLALLALGYAAVSLSSSPPILLLIFGFAAVYALASAAAEAPAPPARSRLALLLRYGAACVLALGLVACYYLPVAALISVSRHASSLYADAAREHLPAVTLLQLLSPDLLGGSAFYTGPALRDPAPWRMHAIGVAAMFAAALAGPGGTRRRSALFALALASALVVAGKAIGLPPMQWASGLPLLRSTHFAVYSSFLLLFQVALLSGIGADRLWRGELSRRRPIWVGAFLALALVAVLLAARGLGLGEPVRPALLNWLLRFGVLCVFGIVLAASARVAVHAPQGSRRLALALAVFFVVGLAEGVHNLSFPRQRRFDVWRHPPPHVQALQALADGRRYADYRALNANTGSPFGIFGLDSLMTFNADRLNALYERHFKGPRQQFLREMSAWPSEPLLDRAGIGWLAVGTQQREWLAEATRRGYAQRYRDEWATLFGRPGGVRYLVTPSYSVMPAAEALEQVAERASLEVLLEEAPSFPARPFDPQAAVRTREFRDNSFVLEVDTPGPSLLYCAESHMPGWTATIDGRPARILAANYAFRAVELPAGRSTVAFRYVPPGLKLGLALSVASLAAFAALLGFGPGRRTAVR